MSNKKIAIILAHKLVKSDGQWVPSIQTKERIERGIYLLTNRKAEHLIMSGDRREWYNITLAQAMKNYASDKGIKKEDLILEEMSRDTVGQLVFVKQGIIIPKNWKDISLVTHDYHGERTRKEAEFIFGSQYALQIELIPSQTPLSTSEKEGSYQTFLRTFEGIESGDNEAILNRLLERHPLYNQNPFLFRRRLEELAAENKS